MEKNIKKTKIAAVTKVLLLSATLSISACAVPISGFTESTNSQSLAAADKINLTDIETSEQADELDSADIINRTKSHVTRSGEVYLMRGLANVFSRGIDEMAETMRDRGIDASNFSYIQWPEIADDIVRRSRTKDLSYPIVIIGHSLGGNESSKFANYLGERGVKVAQVITFDPVETGFVGKNIKQVTNYYLPKSDGNQIIAGADFTGDIKNIDVSNDENITHTNIEKNEIFQKNTLKKILDLTSKKNSRFARLPN